MLQWLLRSRKPRQPQLLPGDQRSAPRHRFNYRRNVPLTVSVGVSSWPALVRDLSLTGISLVVGQRHEPGSRVLARLRHLDRDLVCALDLRVIHVTRRTDGYWLLGCVFAQPLHPDDLQAIL